MFRQKPENPHVEMEIMSSYVVYWTVAGAGSSEDSGSVSVCRTQPDEDGKRRTAEES